MVSGSNHGTMLQFLEVAWLFSQQRGAGVSITETCSAGNEADHFLCFPVALRE